MIIDLSGKVTIITGSTGGIGLAIAKGLADSGATVVVCGREQARVDSALDVLRTTEAGQLARGLAVNVATVAGCEALLAAEPQADTLVNNLGIYGARGFFEISDPNWEERSVATVPARVADAVQPTQD